MGIKIVVRECITEDGIFAGDWDGIDKEASAQKYIDILTERITAEFPEANVDVEGIEQATLDSVKIVTDSYETEDYDAERHAESRVADIIGEVYQDFDAWIVNE